MPSQLDEENQYAEIVTSGIVDRDGSLEMAKAVYIALSKKQIKRLLIDHSNISMVSGGTVEMYHRPVELKEIGMVQDIKVAIVVKPEHNEFFHFLETVYVNRGYMVSVFNDRESALEWLLKS